MRNWSLLLLLTTLLLVWYVGVSEASDSNEEGKSQGTLKTALKNMWNKAKDKGLKIIGKVKQYGAEIVEAMVKKAQELLDKKADSPAKRAAEEKSSRIFSSARRG